MLELTRLYNNTFVLHGALVMIGSFIFSSGSTSLIEPQHRVMNLGLSAGGHTIHRFYTAKEKISALANYFQTLPYHIDPTNKSIDYAYSEKTIKVVKP
ncbi:uncharacterized protein MELLADRAFT_94901 [Melampsora larici-populina 98AG31]|uniref:Serine hydroxymethyltransferase-like domain-containing protein n=1 Tax=Melampsora larici-populina (strain 98AG31 / pathotype 3-4-7) TaxID=747676 RepID=F4S8C0_MELLP|nr:uncharacterized protein MELLADRAFT_94901 [Melampsora larici-populina 98AG31]EGF99117.1 hypothetical protein MELLADRAFT_94901 [Melampsora larici-populina 98AG31]